MKYELVPQSQRRTSFIPHDLRYFDRHFNRAPMGDAWELPPVSVHGKIYKAADFVVWMLRAPVVSQKAKDALEALLAGSVEFLPFHSIKGASYFAVNVLSHDDRDPIYKPNAGSVPLVDERVGAVIRDHGLSGVALADPSNNIGRRIVRGESLQDLPGLVG